MPGPIPNREDESVAMVNARTEVMLRQREFATCTESKVAEHIIPHPRFSVIDYYHIDSLEPEHVLRIMDTCGMKKLIYITMHAWLAALDIMDRFHRMLPERFHLYGWMDWSVVERADHILLSLGRLERLVEHGARGIKFWKNLGLNILGAFSALLRIDGERRTPFLDKTAEYDLPVSFHTADPGSSFQPIDRFNERYGELGAHPDWSLYNSPVSRIELRAQRNRAFAGPSKSTFIGAHFAEDHEGTLSVGKPLEQHPSLYRNISEVVAEWGRESYKVRNFLMQYANNVVFDTDLLREA